MTSNTTDNASAREQNRGATAECEPSNPPQAAQGHQPSSQAPKEGGNGTMLRDGKYGATGDVCGSTAPSAGAAIPQDAERPQLDTDDDQDDQDDARDDAIRRMVDAWPPITDAQRARLALLLRPGRTHTDDA